MRKIFSLITILLLAGLCRAQEFQPSELEQEILTELNMARTYPHLYVGYLKIFLTRFSDDKIFEENGVRYESKEGKAAVLEAIRFLENQDPAPPVTFAKGLAAAAREHALDLGAAGKTGHYSQNGDDPLKRVSRHGVWGIDFRELITYSSQQARGHVIGLIVDDGKPARGHRAGVFNSTLKRAGVGCADHKIYTTMCVIDLSGRFNERTTGGAVLVDEIPKY